MDRIAKDEIRVKKSCKKGVTCWSNGYDVTLQHYQMSYIFSIYINPHTPNHGTTTKSFPAKIIKRIQNLKKSFEKVMWSTITETSTSGQCDFPCNVLQYLGYIFNIFTLGLMTLWWTFSLMILNWCIFHKENKMNIFTHKKYFKKHICSVISHRGYILLYVGSNASLGAISRQIKNCWTFTKIHWLNMFEASQWFHFWLLHKSIPKTWVFAYFILLVWTSPDNMYTKGSTTHNKWNHRTCKIDHN